jgi:hypothetical protein
MNFHDLLGRIVIDTFFNSNDGCLYMATHVGVVRMRPYGECCAGCYIQHISNSDALRKSVVLRVEEVGSERTNSQHGDVSDVWGHVLHTDKGTCTIEMRVDHNGYYGGSLELENVDRIYGDPVEDF